MPEQFDPYYELLGIPPREQPPHHYRLLGIERYEDNKDVIANAASRQMQFLRKVGGPYADECQKLLNEVATAKLCLLDDAKRSHYDHHLRLRLGQVEQAIVHSVKTPPEPPPVVQPAVVQPAVVQPAVVQPAVVQPAVVQPAERGKTEDDTHNEAFDDQDSVSPFAEQKWDIGSDAICDIRIQSGVVSRRHCRLVKTSEGLFLKDLGSTNGTYVNHRRIVGRVKVSPKDTITLGKKTPFPWPEEVRTSQSG